MYPGNPRDTAESLGKFRQEIYESFPLCRDATVNLLDSLCTNTAAGSVVELSLNGPFDRAYIAKRARRVPASSPNTSRRPRGSARFGSSE
jgi:hypothetical protein